jgi:hypothetical protein
MTLKVLMKANWISSRGLRDLWDKLGDGNYSFSRDGLEIRMVYEAPYDYVVVVNGTDDKTIPLHRTIYLVMEPVIRDTVWAFYRSNPSLFRAVWDHRKGNYNNNEWHLSKTRQQLINDASFIVKTKGDAVSAVLSDKYFDEGHKLRVNLALKAQHELEWHSYGGNGFKWKDYRGALPMYSKDEALFPYKYTFNAENTFIEGYYTEKLIDAILSECLCFYAGPPDIDELVDSRAFVKLDMSNAEESIRVMKRAIEENWYAERLPYIRRAKQKILQETGFFPRLHALLRADR